MCTNYPTGITVKVTHVTPIHVPGHTPGSVAVHVPAVDALFIGDTMTTRNVLTGPAWDHGVAEAVRFTREAAAQ